MVEIAFGCGYCGETLATEVDESGIATHDEVHSCFGEQPGYLGRVTRDGIITKDDIDIIY